MMRLVPIARLASPSIFVGIGSGLLALCLAGCPETLPPDLMGGVGGAGSQGAGGDTGSACADAIFTAKCATPACHQSVLTQGGLDLTPPVAPSRLIDVAPAGPKCTTGVFLQSGSNPASGLLLDNLQPMTDQTCGYAMPFLGLMLAADEITCLQDWANGIVGARP